MHAEEFAKENKIPFKELLFYDRQKEIINELENLDYDREEEGKLVS